ncbi:early growth response protein 3 isoform X5 [Bubalus bubalis]|uniref:early growth response protein 3 isoform X5 n=2 Tax=Bubalus bubalis TaxID=89462 RepID=UPI000DBC7088|nr:early growth response protein 3 isoform X5 [Bubalus bubalis]
MTGKLAEKLPVTMSSLLNQLPDNLYPEEIPSALNLFSGSSDSVAHYNQMATGFLSRLGSPRNRLSPKQWRETLNESMENCSTMSKSAVKISLDLLSNPLCEQDQDFLNMVTALDTAMKRMDAFNQEKVNQIQKTVIEPLKKFGSVFPSLNMAVKRREQALQDYRRLQAKVEKYEEKEKTGPVLAKLHQAREELRPVRDDFEAKNKQLLDEMPRFYNSRLDYFQPSFESLIRAQVVYYSEMHKIFGDLTQQLDQPGCPDEQRERENEARLSELRALSIVADD